MMHNFNSNCNRIGVGVSEDDERAIAAHVMRNSGQETQQKWNIAKEGEFIFPLNYVLPHTFLSLIFALKLIRRA
jgi:hypothetical protein